MEIQINEVWMDKILHVLCCKVYCVNRGITSLLFHLFLVPRLCLATSVGWVEKDSFPNHPTTWKQPLGTSTEHSWGLTSTDICLGQGVHLPISSPSKEGQNSCCQRRTHTCPACLNHYGPMRAARGSVGEETIIRGNGWWSWDQNPPKLCKSIPPAMTRTALALRLLHNKYALERRENTHIFNLIALRYLGLSCRKNSPFSGL